jgi:hypothetical protein
MEFSYGERQRRRSWGRVRRSSGTLRRFCVPPLTITYQGGQYELVIPNQGSVGLVDTEDVVQTLAEAMTKGVGEVLAQSEFIFSNTVDRGMIEGIFSSASELALETEVVYAAAEGATLLDFLAAAGTALLGALA